MKTLCNLELEQCYRLLTRFHEAGLTPELARDVLNNPDLAKAAVAALKALWVKTHNLFTPVEDQLRLVSAHNDRCSWGFTEDDFRKAEENIPIWPEKRLVAVTLVPYLDDVQATFAALCGVVTYYSESFYGASDELEYWNDRFNQYDPEHLRLFADIQHPGKCLRWEVIDLGANRGEKIPYVHDAKTMPHAGIIAATAFHSGWRYAMNGDDIPYVCALGYACAVSNDRSWQRMPCVGFTDSYEGVWLGTKRRNDRFNSDWSAPVFVK